MSVIARAGKGCMMTLFDAQDAYKQLLVRIQDLHQQVFMADGQYFIDFCASFGSLYGNDAYSCFAYVHCALLALAAKCPLLFYYVDNYFNVTPFAGVQTLSNALAQAARLRQEAINSGILFHQFEGPTDNFIGWLIDTEAMTVCIS